jgi:heterogeneous nuclear ribonucleoprotein F/H
MFNEREQPTGEAYVEFSSPDDRERAMTKDRQHIGGRYVELFRVNRQEMIQALEQFVGGYMNNNNMQMAGGMGGAAPYGAMYGGMQQSPYGQPFGAPSCGGPGAYSMQPHQAGVPPNGAMASPGMNGGQGSKPGTLRMRGLPYRATAEDVFRFFTGFQIVQNGVVLGQRDGRSSGEAWVTFASPQESQRAMIMNNKHMGNRYVEIFAA